MKTRNFQKPSLTLVALALLALMAGNAVAQDSSTATTANAAPPAAVSQAVPQLSYGVPQVLQRSQAKVGESTIITYIRNSGNNYGLDAAQIIYLRQQGVSDTVINAMINQRSQPAQTTSTAAATSQSYSADATTQPAVTYVQTVPTSSVYVVPDTQTYQYNNWLYYQNPYYPYYSYYPAYYYPYPAVSVSFGWGGRWGGWPGGGHDGGFRGGGFHGGGHDGGFHGGGGGHRR